MSILYLFLQFLKIGAVSFGGGYGMISLIHETVLTNHWLTESELLTFIAVSESTPGSLAVNLATFIGTSIGGMSGALLATLGVILPAFIIILLISSLMKNLLKYAPVKCFLTAVRPCIAALIMATAVIMGLKMFCGIEALTDSFRMHTGKIIVFFILFGIGIFTEKVRHKTPSPICMIVISAGLGILVQNVIVFIFFSVVSAPQCFLR